MADYNDNIVWPGWETVRLIGRGSFGAVYEIERDNYGHKEKAALKVISIPQRASDIDDLVSDGYDEESITSRFEGYMQDIVREYSMMADMKGCANIVYCDDWKSIQHDDGMGWDIFIKMELLTALPRVLSKTITDEQVIRIGMDICNALAFCESRNLLHRDIKPQNIFVAPDGTYKLGDFGIAKTAERTTSGTKTGTYKYMAPEVYNNQPYGGKADIYSLGLVLYWLLNERRTPFLPLPPATPTSTEEDKARAKRFSGELIPAPAHGSKELQRIVLKACAFDQKDRYQNAEEMLQDLKLLQGDAVLHESTTQKKNGAAGAGSRITGGEQEALGNESFKERTTPQEVESEDSTISAFHSAYSSDDSLGDKTEGAFSSGQRGRPSENVNTKNRKGPNKTIIGVLTAAVLCTILVVAAQGSSGGLTTTTEQLPSTTVPVSTTRPTSTSAPKPTSTPIPTVAPTPSPMPTPVPTQKPQAPSEADLKAVQGNPSYPNQITFPRSSSYLSEAETMYVKTEKGNHAYLYWAPIGDRDHRRAHDVPEGTEVTVLAREKGFSCIIFMKNDSIPISGWVSSEMLVYNYS